MAGAQQIGTGAVVLTANADQMLSGLDKAQKGVEKWAHNTTQKAAKAGGGSGGSGGGGLLKGLLFGAAAGGAAGVCDEGGRELLTPADVDDLMPLVASALGKEIVRRNRQRGTWAARCCPGRGCSCCSPRSRSRLHAGC